MLLKASCPGHVRARARVQGPTAARARRSDARTARANAAGEKAKNSADNSCFYFCTAGNAQDGKKKHSKQGHQTRTNKEGVSAILSFLRPDLRSSVRIMDFDHLIAIV